MKQVIFTADDFGLTPEVNAAVVRAHRDGVLTTASLMIGAPAAQEAIGIARMLPSLGVGLHVTVADGAPYLPPTEIPNIVNDKGMLPSNLAAAGMNWFFSPKARTQIRKEITAQFAAFRETGLVCDHINAHNHMHLHPTVLSIIMECAKAHGIRHVRLPYEPGAMAEGGSGLRRMIEIGLVPWIALMRRRLLRAGFVCNDWLAGLSATGHMTEARVLRCLSALEDGVTEFYFHPAEWASPALQRAAPGYDRTGELDALLSPAVAHRIQDLGLKSGVFRDLP
jgi:hopanoid biosynthesis associated protein HpnK